MELWIGFDAEQFADRARAFVEAELERNVLATVLAAVRAGRYDEAIFAVACDEAGETVGAAIRTPPHLMLASGQFTEPDAFLEAWQGIDPELPGVSAQTELARILTEEWMSETGGESELDVAETLHLLGTLVPPDPPVPGELALADFRESALLEEWGLGFAADAGVRHAELIPAAIQRALEERRLYVWREDERSVSMVGHTNTILDTVRIGPVYTPAALRGRGFASAATAALSQRLLDAGARRCVLYTDAANPISNHVYAKIGYRPICDWEEHRFLPPTSAPRSPRR